jgi:hypothetical protein
MSKLFLTLKRIDFRRVAAGCTQAAMIGGTLLTNLTTAKLNT